VAVGDIGVNFNCQEGRLTEKNEIPFLALCSQDPMLAPCMQDSNLVSLDVHSDGCSPFCLLSISPQLRRPGRGTVV
jgi:hypothetical protein